MIDQPEHEITHRQTWGADYDGVAKAFQTKVVWEASDTIAGYWMRLIVNGDPGPWAPQNARGYEALYVWKGWAWATQYWGDPCPPSKQPHDALPIEIPFRMVRVDSQGNQSQ